MAVEIATAYVNIVPSARGFGRALGGEASAAGAQAGSAASDGFGSTFLSGIGKIAKLAGAALIGIGVAAGGYGLKIASENEQATISFETLLGSAEAGQAMIADLKKFAAETPFEFPELQKASSLLLTTGVAADKIIPIMKTLGDVTSATGTGAEGVRRATLALQQMSASGRILGQDLNQLRDAGIPVFDLLAGATGKSKEELTALAREGGLGKKELDQLFKALETGKGLEKFNGLMEKQSQSLKGMFSTFKDVLGQGLAEVMAPVLPILKDSLKELSAALGPLLKQVGPVFTALVTRLIGILARLAPVFGPIIESVLAVANALLDVLIPVIDAVAPVFAEVVKILEGGLIMALQGIAPVVVDLVKAFLPLVPVLAKLLGTGFVIFITLAGGLVIALTPLIELIAEDMAEALEDVIPMFLDLAHELLPLFPAINELVKAFAPLVSLLVLFYLKVLQRALPALIPFTEKLVEMANVLAVNILPHLQTGIDLITRFFDAFLRGDEAEMSKIGGQIGAIIEEAKGKFGDMFTLGLAVLTVEFQKWWDNTAWPWLTEKGKVISDWFEGWIKEQTDKIPGWLKTAGELILAWLKGDLPGLIAEAAKNLWVGITNGFIDAINGIIAAWNGLHFGEILVDGRVIFEGFSPPQVELLKHVDHFAGGGRPPTNRPSLVGELGPELFVPDTAGTVIPNNAMGGLTVEHLEVHGQDQPHETAFAMRKELRWLSMAAGGM